MTNVARALFSDIIDYAGLFPPAALPMDEAFGRFLTHRSADHGWMLARFVCPAARLGELAPLIETADFDGLPIRVAGLGAGGGEPPEFSGSIERDVEAMGRFSDDVGGAATIDVFEVKLPAGGDPSDAVDLTFHQLAELETAPMPFFEIRLLRNAPAPRAVAAAVAAASHEIDPARRAGLKIRCGGLDAAAVPSVEAVAAAVIAARDTELPLKATQGLHHPIRHHDEVLGATVHGFVNLTAAVLLAGAHRLDGPTVGLIVAEQSADAFTLSNTTLGWRDLDCTVDEIRDRRRSGFTGVGSCSFSEPCVDLARLGWI